MQEWESQLADLLARGRRAYGDDRVRASLEDLLLTLESKNEPVPLRPLAAVLGVSPCEAGWVGVMVRPSGQTTLHVGATLAALVEQAREQEALAGVGLQIDTRTADLEAWLNTRPSLAINEIHSSLGRDDIADAGLAIPAMYTGMGFTEDDLMAACSATVEMAQHCS